MKYVLAILLVWGLISAGLLYEAYNEKNVLDAELGEAKAKYELVKAHIEYQNKAIQQANETLKNYQGKITEIEKEYDLKLTAFQKQVKNIKTCEDGYNYLKKMLDELKAMQ